MLTISMKKNLSSNFMHIHKIIIVLWTLIISGHLSVYCKYACRYIIALNAHVNLSTKQFKTKTLNLPNYKYLQNSWNAPTKHLKGATKQASHDITRTKCIC